MSKETKSATTGAHHVGLTVRDLEESTRFFVDDLGYEKVGEVPDYPAAFVTDGKLMIALWRAVNPDHVEAFDRKNVIGLHHLALAVENETALDDLYHRLTDVENLDIEFAPEPLSGMPARHMMCNIPGGGIRVEFIAMTE